MSIFAERVEQTELMALPISVLSRVEWECTDLEDFVDELKNPKMIRRLKYAYQNVKSKHVFARILRNIPHHFEVEEIIYMLDHLKEIGHEHIVIGSTMFNNKRQFPREFIEANIESIEMYHVENQSWIDPEFYEKHIERMDTDNFWCQFGRVRSAEQVREWYEYNNNQYVELMNEHSVFEQFTAEQLTEIGIPIPSYYSTVITAQRIMSGDPCHDGQRSYAIWLRKYRRVYNDPDGFPTWGHLLDLCHKHPRMNHDGYVDWIRSRCLHNSEETVRQARDTLEIKPKSIDDSTYQNVVQNTDDDNTSVVVPEFRDEVVTDTATVPPSMFSNLRAPGVSVRVTDDTIGTATVRPTIMGAPIGSFSPEMIRVAQAAASELNEDMIRLMQMHVASTSEEVWYPPTQAMDRTQRPRVEGVSVDYQINPSLMGIHRPMMWNPDEIRISGESSSDDDTDEGDQCAEPDAPDEPEE